MGLFGLFKPGKKLEHESKATEEAATMPGMPGVQGTDEPEFLKEIDTASGGVAENAVKQEVEPELALWLSNGTTVRSLNELAAALKKLSAKDYKEHVNKERNELADWVQDTLNDNSLARQLRRAETKMQAAQAVEKEMKSLKAARTTGKIRKLAAKTEKPKEEFRAAMRIPEIPELTEELPPLEEPEEPKANAKPKLSFWPFKKKERKEELELAEIPSIPDLEGEAEPQHEKWEELPLAKAEEAEPVEEMIEPPEDKETRQIIIEEKEAEESKMQEESPRLSHEVRELEQMENALEREEEELNMKRVALTRRKYELIKRKGDLDKKRFDEFIRRQKEATEMEGSLAKENVALLAEEEPRETRLEGMPDFRLAGAYGKERLVALMEEAKQHIRENNVAEAQKALGEIQAVFSTIYMPANEKKQIEYEILEVEHDLKLASLK